MGCRLHTLLIALVLLSASACAYTVNNINLAVDRAGIIEVEEKVIVYAGETEARVKIPANPEGLKVSSGNLPLTHTLEDSGDLTEVVVSVNTSSVRSLEVLVSYTSKQLTSKSGGVWTLNFPARVDPYRTIMQVTLPYNTTILDWGPKTRFTPTSDGIFVYPEQEEYDFILNYSVGGDTGKGASELVYYALGLIAAAAAVVFYRRRTSKKDESKGIVLSTPVEVVSGTPQTMEVNGEQPEEESEGGGDMKESVYQMLEENERKIVDVLLARQEDITQAQICREAGIPKATLSDLMRRLEKRNVVERERQGRRNWVKLKKWVFK